MNTEKEFLAAIKAIQEVEPVRERLNEAVKNYMYARFEQDPSWRGVSEDHEYFPTARPIMSRYKIVGDNVEAVLESGKQCVEYTFPVADLWTSWEKVSRKFSK